MPSIGSVPVGQVSTVVLYATTGEIVHIHQAVSEGGADAPNAAAVEQEAFAILARERPDVKVRPQVLHVADADLKRGFIYRVDPAKHTLLAQPAPRVQKRAGAS